MQCDVNIEGKEQGMDIESSDQNLTINLNTDDNGNENVCQERKKHNQRKKR